MKDHMWYLIYFNATERGNTHAGMATEVGITEADGGIQHPILRRPFNVALGSAVFPFKRKDSVVVELSFFSPILDFTPKKIPLSLF